MKYIKILLFVVVFLLVPIVYIKKPEEQNYIYFDEHFIEKGFNTNKNLMYTKNFDEYKSYLYYIINSITKDV